MSSLDKNLSSYSLESMDGTGFKIGIVVAEWNQEITDALLDGCKATLEKHGVKSQNLPILRVPGSFELPIGARLLDDKHNLDAVICLGCVIKGETSHNEYINQSVASGLMQIGLHRAKPFIFGVLTPNDQQQAIDRAGGKLGNKGIEAAVTALQMAQTRQELQSKSKTIGFA